MNFRDAGDPSEVASAYDAAGADEVVFLDITASADSRATQLEWVRKVASKVFIPFTVGGGIRTVDDFKAILREGADKISVNSAAIMNPQLISDAAEKFGSQCVVVAIDAKKRADGGGWNIYKNGGRVDMGMDAVEWARTAEKIGNITTHRSEYVYKDLGNGLFQRNRLRRRPGTVAVAAAIQNKYNITVVPHLLCSGFTREETEYVLLDLQFLGITDLLVLRGDKAKHESVFTPEGDGYHHAIELQEQINNFNKGIFVDGSEMKVTNTPFSYGVACYPEKHEEAPNIDTDIYWLKKKMENRCRY